MVDDQFDLINVVQIQAGVLSPLGGVNGQDPVGEGHAAGVKAFLVPAGIREGVIVDGSLDIDGFGRQVIFPDVIDV